MPATSVKDASLASDPAHLCVTRHGETDWNAEGILQGWIDVPLNREGKRQMQALALSLREQHFDAIISSSLIRALESATIVAATKRMPPPLCHDGLKERHFGIIQGVPKAELAELNPVLLQQILRRNPAIDFEGCETMDEFASRVLDAIMEVGAQYAGKRVLVVTHGWAMDVITRHIHGQPRTAILPMKRKNGEGLWLEVTGDSILSRD